MDPFAFCWWHRSPEQLRADLHARYQDIAANSHDAEYIDIVYAEIRSEYNRRKEGLFQEYYGMVQAHSLLERVRVDANFENFEAKKELYMQAETDFQAIYSWRDRDSIL